MQKIPQSSVQTSSSANVQKQRLISFSANCNQVIFQQFTKILDVGTKPESHKLQPNFYDSKKYETEKMIQTEKQQSYYKYKKGQTQKIESNRNGQMDKQTDRFSSSSQNDQYDDNQISIVQQQVKPQDIKTKRISLLIKKQETKQFIELDCLIPDVYESQIFLSKNKEDYNPNRANICGLGNIQFSNFSISIKGIRKITIYPTIAKKKSFKIKIRHVKDEFSFGVQLKKQLNYLPQHYIWFAKIINARLIKQGVKLQCKIKNPNLYNQKIIFNQGFIYKCSKYRKKWEKRFIVINNQGLFSFKNPKESYTMSIPSASIVKLSTEFDLYGQYLIIKLMHKKEKTGFAIPILDFCLKQDHSNWLFSFYRLLMEHKIHIKI